MAKGASKSAADVPEDQEDVGEYRRVGDRAADGGTSGTEDPDQAAPLVGGHSWSANVERCDETISYRVNTGWRHIRWMLGPARHNVPAWSVGNGVC